MRATKNRATPAPRAMQRGADTAISTANNPNKVVNLIIGFKATEDVSL